jgi:hypothetical protein
MVADGMGNEIKFLNYHIAYNENQNPNWGKIIKN